MKESSQTGKAGNTGQSTPRAYFTSKKGQRFYAADYGYKAWPIGKQSPKSK